MRKVFGWLYTNVLKRFLFLFDPETDHELLTNVGEFLGRFAITRRVVDLIYGYHGPDISKTVDGIRYKTPIILSAGFDYNGKLPAIMQSMGFGGEEVGSVTLRPCEGNEKPRLGRALKSKSLIIWKGLRNDGVVKVIDRLNSKKATTPPDFVVGISIARTNDSSTSTDDAGIADYVGSYQKLKEANIGNYYTLNISCPNAFGGESFAQKNRLAKLLRAITSIRDTKPIYVKFPINPPWEEIRELIDVCLEYKIEGIIIGNLNKNYEDLDYRNEAPATFRGGLSGKPCRELSTALIRQSRAYVGNKLTIIGVGGILSPEDAFEKLDAGADLLMLITGMIIVGPQLAGDINDAIAKRQNTV